MKPLPEIIRIIANDTSPPLWNITEWLAFEAFGPSEVVIRSLSLLYFLLTVFFTYKIGKHLFNSKTGIIAAILTFLNPFFFIYAFEGRMYSILALGVTASMYFFLKRNWVGYVIAMLWALYSHHFAIFALFLHGLWFLKEYFFGKRSVAISMFKSFVVIGFLYLPWVIPLYNQTRKVGGGFWLGTPNLKDLGKLIVEYLATGIKHDLALPALYVMFALLLVRRWGKKIGKSVFLLVWFLGPILLTWAVSQVFQSIFFNRYLLYAIPGGMLIPASNRRKLISPILISSIILMFLVIDYNYFTHPAKLPFREMSQYIKQTRQEGDILINWNAGSHHLWEMKFYGVPAPLYIPGGGELPFFVGTALMEEEDVIRILPETNGRVGVVTSGSIDDIELPGYTEDEQKILGNLKFIWYQKE